MLKQSLIRNVQDIDSQICPIHLLAAAICRKGTKPSHECIDAELALIRNKKFPILAPKPSPQDDAVDIEEPERLNKLSNPFPSK